MFRGTNQLTRGRGSLEPWGRHHFIAVLAPLSGVRSLTLLPRLLGPRVLHRMLILAALFIASSLAPSWALVPLRFPFNSLSIPVSQRPFPGFPMLRSNGSSIVSIVSSFATTLVQQTLPLALSSWSQTTMLLIPHLSLRWMLRLTRTQLRTSHGRN